MAVDDKVEALSGSGGAPLPPSPHTVTKGQHMPDVCLPAPLAVDCSGPIQAAAAADLLVAAPMQIRGF